MPDEARFEPARPEPWWPLQWGRYSSVLRAYTETHPTVQYVADRKRIVRSPRYRVQVTGEDPSKSFCTKDLLELRCFLLEVAYPGGNDG